MSPRTFFRKWLNAIEPSPAERARIAPTLRIVLVLNSVAAAVWVASALLLGTGSAPSGVLVAGASAALLLAWLQLERGRAVTASWVVVCVPIAATSFGLVLQGVGEASLQGGYMLAVIAAGLLLGGRAAGAVAAICVACLGGLDALASAGVLPEPDVPSQAERWVMGGLILAVGGGMLAVGARRSRESSAAAGRSRVALRRSNRELRASRDRYEALAEHAGDLVAELDAEGRFLYANPAFFNVLGIPRGELKGRLLTDLSHEDTLDQTVRFLDSSAEVTVPQLFHALHRDGSSRFLEIRVAHYLTPNGEFRRILMGRDVTRRLESEERMRLLEERMARTQRTESLGLLAGGIAHDFSNVLTDVLAHAEDARLDLDDDHPAALAIDEIVRAGEGGVELVRQLFAYAGKGEIEVAPVDLARLAGDTARMMRLDRTGTVLRCELGDRPVWIRADALQVKQVVLNLLANAREAISDTGTITLRAGVSTGACSDAAASVDYAYLEVSDTGRGMDGETLDRVFEPFYTTRATGRGLGMSTVQGVVRSHGGVIDVSSEAGEGTTVRVCFPWLGPRAAAVRPATAPGASRAGSR